ncbi:MAG: tetrahydromethanopterin S-methyltransferase subunit A [Methanotrichaceae archaeon]|nr:tetrahydromethanopterin S-methyltransferase subunit A [Methanotrichaceae archaeon]
MDKLGPFRGGTSETWPPIRGDYHIGDPARGVAVLTLASRMIVEGAAICGPCVTENLGIEKVISNVISNSRIRFVLICGQESRGHLPGDAILALHRDGVDDQGRIVGARGAIPYIQNLPREAVARFQRQVELVDRIGLEDGESIERLVEELQGKAIPYPEPPFYVVSRRASRRPPAEGEGDVIFGGGVCLDSRGWLAQSEA